MRSFACGDGGYRTWRKPNWPNGPDAWIRKCLANGILPGLWFSTNTLVKINAAPEWQDSLTEKKGSMSFSEGGFLPNFNADSAILVRSRHPRSCHRLGSQNSNRHSRC
jgi:hypothetical protein